MVTLYADIFDKFYKNKLMDDKEYFFYKNLTNAEIDELAKEHSINLMNKAINLIYTYGVPQVDFYNQDSTMEQFNFELTNKEIDIIIDAQYYFYMCEPRNKMKVLGLTFKNSELNSFSPASDRDSYEKMLKTLHNDIEFSIQNYLNRDRLTHQVKAKNFG